MAGPVVCALAIVPGPGGTVTFVQQERGPYVGQWLLPGGKVERGEGLAEAAAREAREESGCQVGRLVLSGVYEIRSVTGGYHWVSSVFVAEEERVVPAGFNGRHVGEVRQIEPARIAPHPTVMRMLVDAGLATYPREQIEAALAADDISLTCHLSLVPVR